MASSLFSQIPSHVLRRANVEGRTLRGREPKKPQLITAKNSSKRKRIEDENSDSSDTDTVEIDVQDVSTNEPESVGEALPDSVTESVNESYSVEIKSTETTDQGNNQECQDAIVQTDFKVQTVSQSTQTDETMMNMQFGDNDQQRFNQAFFTMYAIPKTRSASGPPLKIGLTLRGKKRRVFYPHNTNSVDSD